MRERGGKREREKARYQEISTPGFRAKLNLFIYSRNNHKQRARVNVEKPKRRRTLVFPLPSTRQLSPPEKVSARSLSFLVNNKLIYSR